MYRYFGFQNNTNSLAIRPFDTHSVNFHSNVFLIPFIQSDILFGKSLAVSWEYGGISYYLFSMFTNISAWRSIRIHTLKKLYVNQEGRKSLD